MGVSWKISPSSFLNLNGRLKIARRVLDFSRQTRFNPIYALSVAIATVIKPLLWLSPEMLILRPLKRAVRIGGFTLFSEARCRFLKKNRRKKSEARNWRRGAKKAPPEEEKKKI